MSFIIEEIKREPYKKKIKALDNELYVIPDDLEKVGQSGKEIVLFRDFECGSEKGHFHKLYFTKV